MGKTRMMDKTRNRKNQVNGHDQKQEGQVDGQDQEWESQVDGQDQKWEVKSMDKTRSRKN